MSKPKPAPLPSGTVVGGYQIVKKLAAGGFGVVYLAEGENQHFVAIKEYLPSSLAERSPGELTPRVKPDKQPLYRLGLKSFFEEGRSLAQISHPSVVSVLNFFRENETVYMVMNYLQGDTCFVGGGLERALVWKLGGDTMKERPEQVLDPARSQLGQGHLDRPLAAQHGVAGG